VLWVMWNLISICLETVLVSVQDRYTVLRRTYHRLRNRFGRIQWFSLVTRLKWKLDSVHLEIVLILTQDRSMLCIKRTQAQKSFWMHPMILQGDVGHVESCFGPFGDNVRAGVGYVLRQTYDRLRNHFGRTQ
jgi:hypothetical protein